MFLLTTFPGLLIITAILLLTNLVYTVVYCYYKIECEYARTEFFRGFFKGCAIGTLINILGIYALVWIDSLLLMQVSLGLSTISALLFNTLATPSIVHEINNPQPMFDPKLFVILK